jgi:hypothetical protein
MASLTFYVPRYRPVRWGCGQPLGTKGSWPLYNIASEVVDLVPQLRVAGKRLPIEIRVGDDTMFVSRKWSNLLSSFRKELGVRYSDTKGIISKSSVEICKQYYTKLGEVTPLSADLVDKAYAESSSFGMLIERLRESSNVSFDSKGIFQLASETSLAKRRDGTYGVRNKFFLNRLAIIDFLGSDPESYRSVVRLITLQSIKRALVETLNVYCGDNSMHSKVTKYVRYETTKRLRNHAFEVLTDPNPRLDWNALRRLTVSPPKWLTPKVMQRRLSVLCNFTTIGESQYNEKLVELQADIQRLAGNI